MKLDRNTNPSGWGKYALILCRKLDEGKRLTVKPETIEMPRNAVDFGGTTDTDFFVIRLRDRYAAPALEAYARAAQADDPEYAGEVMALARMARAHPHSKKPD